jgi:hypothetical protein
LALGGGIKIYKYGEDWFTPGWYQTCYFEQMVIFWDDDPN